MRGSDNHLIQALPFPSGHADHFRTLAVCTMTSAGWLSSSGAVYS